MAKITTIALMRGMVKRVTLLWVRLHLGEQPFSFVCDLARD